MTNLTLRELADFFGSFDEWQLEDWFFELRPELNRMLDSEFEEKVDDAWWVAFETDGEFDEILDTIDWINGMSAGDFSA